MTEMQNYHYSERLYIRPLTEDDCNDRYLSWFKDPEVTRFLEVLDLTREDSIRHLKEGLATQSYFMYALCTRDGDLHIGNVKIGPIVRKHGVSDYSLVIGDRAYWGKGYASEATALSTRVGFSEYGIRKFSAGPYSDHYGSMLMLLKAGWVLEGTLRGQLVRNGKVLDKLCLAYFNPEYSPTGEDEASVQKTVDGPEPK
ncbi:GNAT family N-acetyltransferase [Stenotrophobium rhamnosiphilum]|uniref:N-acetyltransferase domain-containing protein n=1 Tax=Stenotrophobium rhamnosiphilum TaxID=2029166 RepID=A0A2T5MIJ5_9GAMM|nr:GNAT family N-acetyltransferase [Stenotrophobium rhamnosiphilum]PTU32374.1 hypothetical protein CJD38_06915 [Stenotrophobium rhamnosiphilum]